MTKRSIALIMVAILGVCGVVAVLVRFEVLAALVWTVLATAVLALLIVAYSQIRAEGATQRGKVQRLSLEVREEAIRLQRLHKRTLRSHSESFELLVGAIDRLSKIEDKLRLDQIQLTESLASVDREISAASERVEAVARSEAQRILGEQNVAFSRLVSLQDALRSVVEDSESMLIRIEEGVHAGRSGVAAAGDSLSNLAESLLRLRSSHSAAVDRIEHSLTDFRSEAGTSLSAAADRVERSLTDLLSEVGLSNSETVDQIEHSLANLRSEVAASFQSTEGTLVREVSDGARALSSEIEARSLVGHGEIAQVRDQVVARLDVLESVLNAAKEDAAPSGDAEAAISGLQASFGAVVDRVSGLLQDSRAEASKEHEGTRLEIAAGFEKIRKKQSSETRKLNVAMYAETQQMESLLRLLPKIEPRWLMPPLGRWALDARSMLHLMQLIDDYRPSRIVELGSGTSTVWLGYIAQRSGASVISIEHDARFKSRTDSYVHQHQLQDVVTTVHAPLEEVTLDGQEYQWYRPDSLEGIHDVDLLLVDGPVGTTSRGARYPAMRYLRQGLSESALILLDDSTREEEAEIVDAWTTEYGLTVLHEGHSRLAVMQLGGETSAESGGYFGGNRELRCR